MAPWTLLTCQTLPEPDAAPGAHAPARYDASTIAWPFFIEGDKPMATLARRPSSLHALG